VLRSALSEATDVGSPAVLSGLHQPHRALLHPTFAMLALWVGFWRAGLTGKARMTGLIVTAVLLAWYLVTDHLARSGFYNADWNNTRMIGWVSPWLVLFL
jgi:hypothetical protein